MKHFSTPSLLRSLLLAVMFIAAYLPSRAEWEQVCAHPTTQAHFITSKGTFLLSDFEDNRQGGIFYSEDKGKTWVKTDVKDYNYHKFYEADGYLYALGYNARIARSTDDGRTWEVLNYSYALKGVVDDKNMEALESYAIIKVDDKLYIGDFAGGGVLVSPDNGETWSLTDRESLYINLEGQGKIMDAFYNLAYFKGYIYAFAALSVHRYDIAADKWEPVNVRSNFMSVSTIFNDCLIAGRSATNVDPEEDYLVYTADGVKWQGIAAPEPLSEFGLSLNVRALHSDDSRIYTAGPDGLIYDPDAPIPFIMCPDFFYTADFGETWTHVAGLPERTYPLTIVTDDEYLYVSIYSPIPTNTASGIWRIAKAELTTGVASIADDGKTTVRIAGGIMELPATADRVSVYNTEGKMVRSARHTAKLDVSTLAKGIYTYEVATATGRVTGKFIK